MTKRLKIGVAGAGVFGGYHASKFVDHAHAVLAGVFDPDGARAKELAQKFSTSSFARLDDLLSVSDAIVVAAPASVHFDIAREAISRGRHTFIEKPVTLNVDQADELIALAAERNLVLQVGHQERYVFAATGLLSRKRAPLKIDSIRSSVANGRCEDVSVALDLMVHDIDLIRKLTRAEIKSLSAEGDRDEIRAEMQLTDGALVSLTASRRASPPERRMTLVYDDGVVEFDFLKREISNSTPAPLHADFSNDDAPLAFTDPLAYGANGFVNSILHKQAPDICGADGREALRWARQIEETAGITAEVINQARERRRA